MKKLIIIIITLIILPFVQSIEYNKVTGDSIFVVGVDWQKQSGTDYTAYVTVDLNYGQYANPLTRYAIVEQYNWNNWWSDSIQFGDVGIVGALINGTSGEIYEFQQLDFYYELPDIKPGSEADDYQCNVQGICGDIVPTTRIGYYGLPFYIQYLEFVCDDSDKNKGGISKTPDLNDLDTITLTRPDYEGISKTEIIIETATAPLGYGTQPGQIVRYNGLPVKCKSMDTTTNARLSFILKPNPLYRHFNPNIEGSETWQYSSIITLLPSVFNSQSIPFNLNIDFNYTTNFWDYEIDTAEELQAFDNSYFASQNNDLICEVETTFGNIEILFFKELTTEQQGKINTGQGIQCNYAPDSAIQDINNRAINDIIDVISFQQQREIVLQLDLLENKLLTKKFITNSIIPFFVIIIIILFYVMQLILIGITFFGIVPMMFNQFILGMKDAFGIDELIKEEQYKQGKVRFKK